MAVSGVEAHLGDPPPSRRRLLRNDVRLCDRRFARPGETPEISRDFSNRCNRYTALYNHGLLGTVLDSSNTAKPNLQHNLQKKARRRGKSCILLFYQQREITV